MKISIFNSKNVIISFCCVVIVFFSNFFIPSQTNAFPTDGINTSLSRTWENENAETLFFNRYSYSEFRRRPFMLESQRLLKEKYNLPYQFSFNLINYSCLFLVFLLLPLLSSKIQKPKVNEGYTAAFFLLSLPIIFAFYGSMCTYDDIIQYLFIIIFLIALFGKNHILAILFLTLACISRETSLVFYFVVIAFLFIEEYNNRLFFKLVLWLIPILAYAAYLEWYVPKELLIESKNYLTDTRFSHWKNNFLRFNKFRESTTILLIMSGIYIFFLVEKIKKKPSLNIKYWCWVSIAFILINSLIISVAALVKEARLLFLPLILVIPLVESEFRAALDLLKQKFKHFNLTRELIIILISFIISFIWFTPKTVGTGYLYKLYAFFYFIFWFELLFDKKSQS